MPESRRCLEEPVLLMSKAEGNMSHQLAIGGALLTVLLINLITFAFASRMMRVLGKDVNAILTRVLGIVLAALSIQFMMDGLKAGFFGG